MTKRFIEVTSIYSGYPGTKVLLSVDGITGMFVETKGASGSKSVTILKHLSHNNGGWEVSETPKQIIELIKNSIAI